mgnify:CR=1 FL=1
MCCQDGTGQTNVSHHLRETFVLIKQVRTPFGFFGLAPAHGRIDLNFGASIMAPDSWRSRTMTRFLLLLSLIVISAPANAINRYDTTGMSCSRIQSVLESEHSAILRYPSSRNPSLSLYDRYVSTSQYCGPGSRASIATVPSSDSKTCRVHKCSKFTGGSGGH